MITNLRIKYLLIFQCLLLISCSDNSKELKFLICNDSIEYWDYNMIRQTQNVWFTYSFDKNGTVRKYSFNKGKNKRWLFSDYGYQKEFKWEVKKDSIFTFMGTNQRIIKISKDTLLTYNLEDKKFEEYIRVKGNLNIQD